VKQSGNRLEEIKRWLFGAALLRSEEADAHSTGTEMRSQHSTYMPGDYRLRWVEALKH
jgi:hypothetical protein